ncbi:MAG: hypothetical protein NXI09_05970 [Bacteroidetes bacterium]|nr:hypothetical protein [Bacteroidota bacterium]
MKKYLLLLIIVLQACSADESFDFKSPSGLSFYFDVNREASKNGRLLFNDGFILISRLQLEGDRVQAEDYFFQNGYQPPILAELDSNAYNPQLQFDFPQGIYNRIEFEFEIPSSNITVLQVDGQFKDSTGAWLPIRLEVSSFELFQVLAADREGEQEIVIEDQFSYSALIRLNTVHWFSGISIAQLEAADRTIINGQSGILIKDNKNTAIYNEVDDRLDELNSLSIR